MKFLIITAVKDYEKDVLNLFKKAEISCFSDVDINGFKNTPLENRVDNWFSASNSRVRSTLFFTFTDAEKIDGMLNIVEAFNNERERVNPIRAIVLDVLKSV